MIPRRTNSKKASKRPDIVATLPFQSRTGSTGTVSQSFVARPWGNCGGVWHEEIPSSYGLSYGFREAGFVESRIDAQRRLYRIKPEPLMEIDAWLAPFRRFWSVHIDALERHLDQMNPVPRNKGKKR